MRVPTLPAVSLASLLLLLALPTEPAAAAEPLAEIENAGTALIFQPAQETAGLYLTVSGPCGYQYESRVKDGPLEFRLGDDAPDGPYTYSLVATPVIDPRTRKVLEAARESGDRSAVLKLCRDGRLPVPPAPQSGGFAVLERKIVFDGTPEAKRRSDRDEETKAGSYAPAPRPDSGGGDPELAATRPRPAPRATEAQCAWARMLPGAGVAER